MAKSIKLTQMFQARVTPQLKWPHNKIVVNFDSQLIFPTFDLAEKFVPYYVRELIELGVLKMEDKFEAGVISLNVFDGTKDIHGVESAS